MGQRYRRKEDQKPGLAFNQKFAKGRVLKPKVKMCKMGDVLSQLV